MKTIPAPSGAEIISKPNSPTTNIISSLMDIHSQNTAYAIGDNQVLTGSGTGKIYNIQQLGGRKKNMKLHGKNLKAVASDAFLKIGGKSALFYVDSHLFYGRTAKRNGRTLNHLTKL